jgi:hypothetical protein
VNHPEEFSDNINSSAPGPAARSIAYWIVSLRTKTSDDNNRHKMKALVRQSIHCQAYDASDDHGLRNYEDRRIVLSPASALRVLAKEPLVTGSHSPSVQFGLVLLKKDAVGLENKIILL